MRVKQWLIRIVSILAIAGLFACGSTEKKVNSPQPEPLIDEANAKKEEKKKPTLNDLRGYLLPLKKPPRR